MFGDPVTNPKAWPLHTLTTVTANKRHAFAIGPFGSNLLSSDYQEAGCPVVFVRDIVSGKYRHKSQVFISHEKAEELVAHTVDCGDVLVTKMGMPPGTACVYPIDVPRAVITADVIKLTPNLSQVLPWYLASELNAPFCKQQIIRISAGITRLKVTLGDFRTIQIRVPPISLQKKYDEFRIATERLRERAECLCSEADDLFSSLTNRAFKEQAISD